MCVIVYLEMKRMKKWFFLVFVVLLILCVYVLIYNGKELYNGL